MVNQIAVHWIKCSDGHWCNLLRLDLDTVKESGVYIIWASGGPVVYVGRGDIEDRLRSHRLDPTVLHYTGPTRQTALLVTWASVPFDSQRGVERYLANILRPRIGERHPSAVPIQVALPWPWS